MAAKKTARDHIFDDALSAWRFLCTKGGLDLGDRDADLCERVRTRLNTSAATVEQAIATASLEDFLSAFFSAAEPFILMFKDILTFFERAVAYESRNNLRLKVGDFGASLDHFRTWVATSERAVTVTLSLPVVSINGWWLVFKQLLRFPSVEQSLSASLRLVSTRSIEIPESDELPDELREWITRYARGEWPDLPRSLSQRELPTSVQSMLQLTQVLLELLRMRGRSYSSIKAGDRPPGYAIDPEDVSSEHSLAYIEHDHGVLQMAACLYAVVHSLDIADLLSCESEIAPLLAGRPRRTWRVQATVNDLMSILSLPVWKKRHELYAVWIATEVVAALDGHEIVIHDENGCLSFSFKETLLATVTSSPGPFCLISEKRSPLAAPTGKGRRSNVQPDYGLWTMLDGISTCKMVIEVKHYKKSSRRAFHSVLTDYARAMPAANVYLVNHGPNGQILESIADDLRNRCFSLERLTADSPTMRSEFRTAVAQCVGTPLPPWPKLDECVNSHLILVCDVSQSMQPLLRSDQGLVILRELVCRFRPRALVAVDEHTVGEVAPDANGVKLLIGLGGKGTDLAPSVQHCHAAGFRVIVVTDRDGFDGLQNSGVTCSSESSSLAGVLVVDCDD